MFENRKDAGQKLASALNQFKHKNPLILAIPRGGVEVAYHVALALNAQLDILIARKLPYPDNPEAGFGAIAEDGSTYINDFAARSLSPETINKIKFDQTREIKRRIETLRQGHPLTPVNDRTVILIDDGIAMGSTIRSAIMLCRNHNAHRVIVAVPVTGPQTARQIAQLVDQILILELPPFFQAVAQAYQHWYDVPDSEVIELMTTWQEHLAPSK